MGRDSQEHRRSVGCNLCHPIYNITFRLPHVRLPHRRHRRCAGEDRGDQHLPEQRLAGTALKLLSSNTNVEPAKLVLVPKTFFSNLILIGSLLKT